MIYTSNLVVGLEKGLDAPEMLQTIADATHTGVEFFLHTYDPEYVRKTALIPEWLGQRPRTTHGPFIGVEASSPEGSAEHTAMLEAYRYGFDTARALGSHHLVFHTHQRVILPEEKEQAQAWCFHSIEQLLEMSRETGVTLLIENLGIQKKGISLFDEQDFIALVERYPEAGCLIDIGHLHVAGWDMEHVLHTLENRILGYHLHNNNGIDDSHHRLLDGTLDAEKFMELYRRYTPEADLTLEYGDQYGITANDVIDDIRWIQNRLHDVTKPQG